jgi:hypothetical protein
MKGGGDGLTFRTNPDIFIGGPEEKHVKPPSVEVCASAGIRNSALPNMSPKRGRLN